MVVAGEEEKVMVGAAWSSQVINLFVDLSEKKYKQL